MKTSKNNFYPTAHELSVLATATYLERNLSEDIIERTLLSVSESFLIKNWKIYSKHDDNICSATIFMNAQESQLVAAFSENNQIYETNNEKPKDIVEYYIYQCENLVSQVTQKIKNSNIISVSVTGFSLAALHAQNALCALSAQGIYSHMSIFSSVGISYILNNNQCEFSKGINLKAYVLGITDINMISDYWLNQNIIQLLQLPINIDDSIENQYNEVKKNANSKLSLNLLSQINSLFLPQIVTQLEFDSTATTCKIEKWPGMNMYRKNEWLAIEEIGGIYYKIGEVLSNGFSFFDNEAESFLPDNWKPYYLISKIALSVTSTFFGNDFKNWIEREGNAVEVMEYLEDAKKLAKDINYQFNLCNITINAGELSQEDNRLGSKIIVQYEAQNYNPYKIQFNSIKNDIIHLIVELDRINEKDQCYNIDIGSEIKTLMNDIIVEKKGNMVEISSVAHHITIDEFIIEVLKFHYKYPDAKNCRDENSEFIIKNQGDDIIKLIEELKELKQQLFKLNASVDYRLFTALPCSTISSESVTTLNETPDISSKAINTEPKEVEIIILQESSELISSSLSGEITTD